MNSGCRYKILLVIWDVVLIIHVDNISTRVIQSRHGMPTPQVSLRLRQEIDRWKLPPMDTLKWFKHNCRSIWTPIFNGLSERTWRTIIQMARAFITEKQVGREIWYFAVRHAAMILNQVPGRLGLKLTTPFELVHNSKPDSKTWFELFTIRYFNHETDNAKICSKLQAHTLDGIAVGRYDRSNSIIFYNPITSSYYHPPVFRLN